MKLKEEMEDILYISKEKYKIIISISIAIYFLTRLISFNNLELFNYINCTFYLIISFCIILLTYSTANVTGYKIFDYIPLIFIPMIFSNLNIFVNIKNLSGSFYENYMQLTPYTNNIIFLVFTMTVFKYLNGDKFKTIVFISIGSFISCMLYLLELKSFGGIAKDISIFLIIGCLFKFYKVVRNLNKTKEKKINYMYMFLIQNISYYICILILYSRISVGVFVSISCFISYISYSSLFFCTIDQMLNAPYKLLFKDLYESSENLNKINKEIYKKNNELEVSQKIVRENEIMFKDFFKSIPIPIFILSSATLRIIYCNKVFLNLIYKENLKDVINKKVSSFIKLDEEITFVNKTIEEKIYRGYIEKNNYKKHLNLEVVDYNKENGEIVFSVTDTTTIIDMNSIKENIEEKILKERIRTDFLSNISHDLKTPINVIYSALQLENIFTKNNDINSLKKYNSICKQNCLALMKLTNNLIDNSRIQSDYLHPTFKRVNIVDFIEDIVFGLVDYAKEKKISLIFDTNNEEVFLHVDENFMQRIMLNLISNSIKFTQIGGEIYVKVTDRENDIEISIEDNGIGMDENFINKIFVKYTMGKNNESIKEKGSGIGLFVVKNLVELQKGKIKINSKEGEGTKFIILFKKGRD
ncbi:HAMP domain-containing sensor histidine kinase [Clostridium baratii]|uniref:sensor histidine kinase n=1 Tax=Clostridium baratii TaxID=1561 RepID=UPI0028FE9716|nr:HAMP domain-containing sensor histidine kinase [Clostridium baratii]MDU1052823.1 HAMP domain-containing sensor histidine kinase [Clostridium baratii]